MPSDPVGNQQGKILEQIVAMLHKYEGVQVETNVKLTPKSGDVTRKREIDVLLTSVVAGYTIRIAIQCKNHGRPIEITLVDTFLGALDDVGIPHQHGILVSVNGFQAGAINRAKEKGLRTLELTGLTKDRLAAEIIEAFQFFVYLSESFNSPLLFVDNEGNYCGDVLDLIVSKWRHGQIPEFLGKHDLGLQLPTGWFQFWQNKPVKVFSIKANVIVSAYVMELVGTAKRFRLVDADTKVQEKFQLNAEFDTDAQLDKLKEKLRDGFELAFLRTEEDLNTILAKGEARVNRIRLPRIIAGKTFQPISARVANMISAETKDKTLEEIDELPPLSFEDYEGKLVGAIHETPLRGFPVVLADPSGETFDLRLLIKNKEYKKVLEFKEFFQVHPTPELAAVLETANQEIGRQILGLG
jgi:Restriction endonuclease